MKRTQNGRSAVGFVPNKPAIPPQKSGRMNSQKSPRLKQQQLQQQSPRMVQHAQGLVPSPLGMMNSYYDEDDYNNFYGNINLVPPQGNAISPQRHVMGYEFDHNDVIDLANFNIGELQSKMSELHEENTVLKANIKSENAVRQSLERRVKDLSDKLAEARQGLQDTRTALIKLQDATEQIIAKRDQREAYYQRMEDMVKNYEARVSELEMMMLSNPTADSSKLEAAINKHKAVILKRDDKIQELEDKLYDAQSQTGYAKRDCKRAVDEKKEVEFLLDAAQKRSKHLEAQVRQLQAAVLEQTDQPLTADSMDSNTGGGNNRSNSRGDFKAIDVDGNNHISGIPSSPRQQNEMLAIPAGIVNSPQLQVDEAAKLGTFDAEFINKLLEAKLNSFSNERAIMDQRVQNLENLLRQSQSKNAHYRQIVYSNNNNSNNNNGSDGTGDGTDDAYADYSGTSNSSGVVGGDASSSSSSGSNNSRPQQPYPSDYTNSYDYLDTNRDPRAAIRSSGGAAGAGRSASGASRMQRNPSSTGGGGGGTGRSSMTMRDSAEQYRRMGELERRQREMEASQERSRAAEARRRKELAMQRELQQQKAAEQERLEAELLQRQKDLEKEYDKARNLRKEQEEVLRKQALEQQQEYQRLLREREEQQRRQLELERQRQALLEREASIQSLVAATSMATGGSPTNSEIRGGSPTASSSGPGTAAASTFSPRQKAVFEYNRAISNTNSFDGINSPLDSPASASSKAVSFSLDTKYTAAAGNESIASPAAPPTISPSRPSLKKTPNTGSGGSNNSSNNKNARLREALNEVRQSQEDVLRQQQQQQQQQQSDGTPMNKGADVSVDGNSAGGSSTTSAGSNSSSSSSSGSSSDGSGAEHTNNEAATAPTATNSSGQSPAANVTKTLSPAERNQILLTKIKIIQKEISEWNARQRELKVQVLKFNDDFQKKHGKKPDKNDRREHAKDLFTAYHLGVKELMKRAKALQRYQAEYRGPSASAKEPPVLVASASTRSMKSAFGENDEDDDEDDDDDGDDEDSS